MRRLSLTVFVILGSASLLAGPQGGGRGGAGQGASPSTGQESAPFDMTGYWVSMVTDFWRYRMLTPPPGNVDYLPINAEGRRVTSAWDPAKDEAAGEQCRGYGAVGVMRLPGRLHITWEGGNTLRLDTDAGTQTRRFVFGTAPQAASGEPTWQGRSSARWDLPSSRRGRASGEGQGQLIVVTTGMRPGYVRKNGIPYSANATLTEYYVRLVDGDQQYLAVTQFLEDSQYFNQPIVRTMLFKKQPDASGWNPTACSAR